MGKRAQVVTHPTSQTNKLKIRIDDLYTFDPLTETQKHFYDIYKEGNKAIMLHGVAGTGKTFIALYKALEEVLDKSTPYDKIIIVRSVVQTRDMGYLPGTEKEKAEVFQRPYIDICQMLFGKPQAFERLQEQGVIEFMTTSFIRGVTFDRAIIIVDESQNMSFQELSSVITRIGEGSKIILCGDFRQTDLVKKYDISGLKKMLNISRKMPSFRNVEFCIEDIVRSDIVKEFIIATMEYEDNNNEPKS